jgi:hypothetical protein
MENYYTAYTKIINGVTFYFVKKYKTFPEYKDVEPVLESYGMHTDFDRACHIAMIDNKVIKEQLLNNLEQNLNTAKLFKINGDKVVTSINNNEIELNDKQQAI